MATYKITEELDKLQKKVASLKEIYKHHPDTVVNINSPLMEETYTSHSVNESVNIIRFSFGQGSLRAYTSKVFGCIELCSDPNHFYLLDYYPGDIFKQLIVQDYYHNMKRRGIPDKLIRECDVNVINFIKKRDIDLSKSNIKSINPESSIGKLLTLL